MATRPTGGERRYTLDQFANLPESDRFLLELSEGAMVREPRPGRRHGSVVSVLCHHLVGYADAHGGVVTTGTGYVLSEEPPTVRGPDVAWVEGDPSPHGVDDDGFIRGAPDLAIEVVSPSNAAAEIQKKVLEYFDAGARQVWVVHPRTRTVVVHGSATEAKVLHADDEIRGGDLLPGFRLPVQSIFRF